MKEGFYSDVEQRNRQQASRGEKQQVAKFSCSHKYSRVRGWQTWRDYIFGTIPKLTSLSRNPKKITPREGSLLNLLHRWKFTGNYFPSLNYKIFRMRSIIVHKLSPQRERRRKQSVVGQRKGNRFVHDLMPLNRISEQSSSRGLMELIMRMNLLWHLPRFDSVFSVVLFKGDKDLLSRGVTPSNHHRYLSKRFS